LAFSDDFGDMSEDLDNLNRRLMKKFQKEIDEMFREITSGKIKGTWETREINEPQAKGFIIQGRFGFNESLEPLDPLKPPRRRPLPENPFELSKSEAKDTEESLTDIFNEEDSTTIYVELPGEKKEDIRLRFIEDGLEVKAKNFYKIIELPRSNLDTSSLTSECKNGVLKITIRKKKRTYKEHARQERMV
ncbi:Hsp20/alpha crystallin family protein, partial [Candidatus Bathyarchaeota archaeon]|jgi:HSP20 family molecular chaperone IbpA|nr:Hsp20/alpha crystallin family protein [Candidatus Bathyarchaeota archaeon]